MPFPQRRWNLSATRMDDCVCCFAALGSHDLSKELLGDGTDILLEQTLLLGYEEMDLPTSPEVALPAGITSQSPFAPLQRRPSFAPLEAGGAPFASNAAAPELPQPGTTAPSHDDDKHEGEGDDSSGNDDEGDANEDEDGVDDDGDENDRDGGAPVRAQRDGLHHLRERRAGARPDGFVAHYPRPPRVRVTPCSIAAASSGRGIGDVQIAALERWFLSHLHAPYPDKTVKIEFAKRLGLTEMQVGGSK